MEHIRYIALTLLLSLSLLGGTSCSRIKDIKVTSCGVESLVPNGLKSFNAVLSLGIDNPALAFTVTDLEGVIKYNGQEVGVYRAGKVSIDRRCIKIYDVPCSASLTGKISMLQIISILRRKDLSGWTTDITAKVKLRSGFKTRLRFRDLDLDDLANSDTKYAFEIDFSKIDLEEI